MREKSQYQIPVMDGLREGGALQTPQDEVSRYRQDAEFFAHQNQQEQAVYSEGEPAQKTLRAAAERLHWYRQEAVHVPVVQRSSVGQRILGMLGVERRELPDLNELIDKESLVGGALFGIPARFWVHPPVREGVDDWYFSFMRGEQEYTVHYQVDITGVHKIYGGREYPFTPGELERLTDAASAYEQRVVRDVYQREPAAFAGK